MVNAIDGGHHRCQDDNGTADQMNGSSVRTSIHTTNDNHYELDQFLLAPNCVPESRRMGKRLSLSAIVSVVVAQLRFRLANPVWVGCSGCEWPAWRPKAAERFSTQL